MDIFKLFLKTTTEDNSRYLFDWIKKCMADSSVNKVDLAEEVRKNVERLVAWDKERTREVIMKLPKQTEEFINALKY